MITTNDVSLIFGSRKLFDEVTLKFTPGNCYGVIGANGAGKSTFLKLLSGELEPNNGDINIPSSANMSVLKQDHFEFDDETVLQTVMLGHSKLIEVGKEKDEIYAKPDFSEEDGVRAAELESLFSELGGWEAESDAQTLLSGLGFTEEAFGKKMKEMKDSDKVKVLLAQALFGNPDILLLDEPTNHLDGKSISWLEDFLLEFNSTVIVVSHDRHFLNKVCTHIVDIDFSKIKIWAGNYDFWKQSSELAIQLRANQNKRVEEKAKDLEAFIRRFSANASKSKQATSRRKHLEKLTLDDIPSSSRKTPHCIFNQEREAGDILLQVSNLSKTINGQKVLQDVSFEILRGEKVIFVGKDEVAMTLFFELLMGEVEPDEGTVKWGVTTRRSYLPKDNSHYFEGKKENLIDWLREFSEDKSENFIRGFLGKMLFSGEETKKSVSVLSGGEKVRCMLSRMMLQEANVLLLDGPTNHLDLESIIALNTGLIDFKGTVLFSTHDHDFAQSLSKRLIEITDTGLIDHQIDYEDYISN